MSTVREVKLWYKDRRSDKVYNLLIERVEGLKYMGGMAWGYYVIAQYGRRSGTLTHVNLSRGQIMSYPVALKLFSKTEASKRAKGYTDYFDLQSYLRAALRDSGYIEADFTAFTCAVRQYIRDGGMI